MPAITLLFKLLVALATVHGTVRTAGNGPAAAGVRIQVDGVDKAITDSIGRYSVSGVPMGEHELQFIAAGYESRRVTIFLVDSTDMKVDVELNPRAIILPVIEVVAQGTAIPRIDNPVGSTTWHEAGHFRFTSDWQARQPAGAVDLQQAIAMLPGVSTRSDNASALSIRGGRGSENLMLLDGIPLIGAVHFAGAPSAINPDAIALFDVHTGVSSARYDGALSGVIELQTSDVAPSHLQINGALSSTDVRTVARAPIGSRGGIMLGGRASFRNLFSDASGLGSNTGYQDFIGAGHVTLGQGKLSLVGFESGNHLTWQAYSQPETASALQAQLVGVPKTGLAAAGDAANWQTGALGVTWTMPLGTGREWHSVGYWSGSTATIGTVSDSRTNNLNSGISEFGMTSELRLRGTYSSVIFGSTVTQPRTWYSLTTPASDTDSATGIDLRAKPILGSLYGEWDWHRSSSVDFRIGLRTNTNFVSSIVVDPRIIVNVHPSTATRIEAGFGRTHQSVQSMLNEENLTSAIIGPVLPLAAAAGVPVARADQWEFSVEHQLGTSTTFSLDAYARTWRNVLTPTATTGALFVPGQPEYGDGNARGVTASVSAERGKISLHAAAGLAVATQHAGKQTFHSGFEQPWSFSGELAFRPRERTAVQLRWNTGAGQARTAVSPGLGWQPNPTTGAGIDGFATNIPGSINALRLEGPMRVDLGLRHAWAIGTGDDSRRSALVTSVRLENLLNRADPIGLMEQPGGSLQLLRGTPRSFVFELGWVY